MAGNSNSGGNGKKPRAQKLLSGTIQPCRDNKNIPTVPELTNISPPKDLMLTDKGEDVWMALSGDLTQAGILKQTDIQAFAVYCNEYARYLEMAEYVKDNGVTFSTMGGESKKRPEVTIMYDALKVVNSYQGRFGLTPVDRERIKIEKKEDNDGLEFLKTKT